MNRNEDNKKSSGKMAFLGALFLALAVITVAFCTAQGVFRFEPKEITKSKGSGLAQIGFESEAPNVNVTPDLSIAQTASPQQTEAPELKELDITIICGPGGKIDPSKSFVIDEGESKVFTIKPGKGNIVKELIIDGQNYGRVLKFSIENIREAHTIEVYFEEKPKPTPSPSPSPDPEPTESPGEDEKPDSGSNLFEDIINIISNG